MLEPIKIHEDLKVLDLDYDVLDSVISEGTADPPEIILKRQFDIYDEEGHLSDNIQSRSNICFILNDRNRPTPTHLLIEELFNRYDDLLNRTGKIIIATGTHKEPTDVEAQEILGKMYEPLKGKVHYHRSRDMESHHFLGETSRGTPVHIDRAVLGHDLIVLVNSVEPHYFAGFTGGRKSIIPGISSYETIETNHSNSLHGLSRTLQLEGNPVHEDMAEACDMFLKGRDHLSIQLIQAPGVVLDDVKVGDVHISFKEAVEVAKRNFCLPIDRLYDIVITTAKEPMNKTLYQSQKAIENGKLALGDGGVLILVSSLHEGIGQKKFWDLLTNSDDPDVVLQRIDEGYELGFHKAANIVQLSQRAEIYVVSEMEDETLKKGFLHGFHTLSEAVRNAVKRVKGTPSILYIPDGAVTVPIYMEK